MPQFPLSDTGCSRKRDWPLYLEPQGHPEECQSFLQLLQLPALDHHLPLPQVLLQQHHHLPLGLGQEQQREIPLVGAWIRLIQLFCYRSNLIHETKLNINCLTCSRYQGFQDLFTFSEMTFPTWPPKENRQPAGPCWERWRGRAWGSPPHYPCTPAKNPYNLVLASMQCFTNFPKLRWFLRWITTPDPSIYRQRAGC